MGTPLKQVRLLLSPRGLISPRTPTNRLQIRNVACIAKKLDFRKSHCAGTKQESGVTINLFPCKSPPKLEKQCLLVNTPNKSEILKHGLKPGGNFSVLGRGTFGTVVRGLYKGESVAVKVVKTKATLNESNALQLAHVNVIKIMDVVMKNEEHSIIIMEFLEGSRELQTALDDESFRISFRDIISFCTDICSGVQHCHENDVLHLDLKPGNVLVCVDGRCKICDFGNSQLHGSVQVNYVHEGTVAYTAPEILLGECPTFASDIYSLGIIFWQLRYRKPPFPQLQDKDVVIYKVVKYGLRPSVQETYEVDDSFCCLYKSCWEAVASKRPTLKAVLSELNKIYCI